MSSRVQPLINIRKKPGPRTTADSETGPKIFKWMTKHQDVFDALKETLSTAPVLGYCDFSREFILETDSSLNCIGTSL